MRRRSFIQKTVLASGLTVVGTSLVNASADFAWEFLAFELPPLPYAFDALEPFVDKQTMEIHHGKHHAAYVKNLNKEAEGNKNLQGKTVEAICSSVSKFNTAVRNNAGGHYNHSLFWKLLAPKSGEPTKKLSEALVKDFGSLEMMKSQFNEAAKSRFGSGWAWLIYSGGKLKIVSTPNQDNPLMDVAETKGYPILALDIWEHAYYLKYQNRRADYIDAFWKIINWDEATKRYELALKK